MKPEEIQFLLREIDDFEKGSKGMSPNEGEQKFSEFLSHLLEPEGYKVHHVGGHRDGGIDIIATSNDDSILVQYKHYKSNRLVGDNPIRAFLGSLFLKNANRGIFFSTGGGFTKQAWEATKHEMAPNIELLDFTSLRSWISRIQRSEEENHDLIIEAVKDFSKKLATIIAQKPEYLDKVEWRDMERLLGVVFEGLGFSVEVTPPSKDGGRDIILECLVSGEGRSYLIEVKHWTCRSRVGGKYLSDFINVVAREHRDGGLFIATYGYASNAFEALTEIDRADVNFGEADKIVALCKTYVKARCGIWKPTESLHEILFNDTQ